MRKDLISILMPAYNAAQTISSAISSVQMQSYRNWELIIVDDGSRDNTWEIIRSSVDDRILSIRQDHGGVSRARNRGLLMASGEFITFLDSDDLLTPDSLSLRIDYMRRNLTVDVLSGSVESFADGDFPGECLLNKWTPSFQGDPLTAFVRIDSQAFYNPALFLRRKENVRYFFNEDMTHVEDLAFFISVFAQEPHNYSAIRDTVYLYRIRKNSAMSNLSGLEDGYAKLYQLVKQIPLIDDYSRRYLRYRVTRIMFLSYLKKKEFFSALKVLYRFGLLN